MRVLGILALAAALLSGCEKKTEPPLYFLSETMEFPDGRVYTRTYTGPKPPGDALKTDAQAVAFEEP